MNTLEYMKTTGSEINYYFVCKRKLWYHSRNLSMEHTSTRVEIGKELQSQTYQRQKKEILIDNTISLDFIEKGLIINETKLTKSMADATLHQILYYIYYLEKKGVEGVTGEINYPKSKVKKTVELTAENRDELEVVLGEIHLIKSSNIAPGIKNEKKCKKCSYYELCFS
ncbi:MAG: CRISPR-associated protein Cas4 [Alkaliphilus sp.]|nr:CRISPR-associated protein Cas4 [bacterium AH-315-E09]PHS35842.1 MAG: CRISPR-associated protein Cas4 [Alkaliphilus sp.]